MSLQRYFSFSRLLFTVVACFGVLLLDKVALAIDAPETGVLLELSSSTFASTLQSHDAVLVMFMADWCGHCKAAHPELQKAANRLKVDYTPTDKIAFATIECTKETSNKEICEDHDVRGFPKFLLFENGKATVEPQIERTSDAFFNFLVRFDGPAIKVLSGVDLAQLTNYKEKVPMAVVYLNPSNANDPVVVEKAAKQVRNFLTVKRTMDSSLFGSSSGATNMLAMYRSGEPATTFKGAWKYQDILNFLNSEYYPLVGEIDRDTFTAYLRSPKLLLYLFHSDRSHRDTHMPALKDLAQRFRDTLNVAFIDAELYGRHGIDLGLKEQWPALVVSNLTSRTKWIHPQVDNMNENSISMFVDGIFSGQLKPHLKSQDIPSTNSDEPARTIVGKNFEEVMKLPNTDVLVFFHAHWCGYCKAFAPTFNSVAEFISPQAKDSIILAKIDATENDIPDVAGVEISGFPTIVLYHGSTKAPLVYRGGRTREEVIEFLRKSAYHSEKIPKIITPPKDEDIVMKGNEEL